MAVEVGPVHQTLDRFSHTFHEIALAVKRHPLRLALVATDLAALGLSGYLYLSRFNGSPVAAETTEASDTFKPPEGGQDIAIVTNPPTEAASPPPESISAPASGYQQQEEKITYKTEKGDILNIPKIKGLTTEVKNVDGKQKVVYIDKQNNEYAGTYNPNVEIEGRQTGGVVLKAPIVSNLIRERLLVNPNEPPIPMPYDISDSVNPISIGFTTKKFLLGETPLITINTDEMISLVNIIPGSSGLRIGISRSMAGYRIYGLATSMIASEAERQLKEGLNQIGVLFPSAHFGTAVIDNLPREFGDEVDQAQGQTMISFGIAQPHQLTMTNVLSVGNDQGFQVPVFLAKNS